MWFVYALFNAKAQRIYIGETSDIERRLEEHNRKSGNHFTARIGGKWLLIYKEEVTDRRQALKREKQLKSYRGREFIKKYIPS
jgi:putative endonuclease